MKDKMLIKNKGVDITVFHACMVLISAIIGSGTPLNSLYYTETILVFLLMTTTYFLRVKKYSGYKICRKTTYWWIAISLLIITTAFVNMDYDVSYYLGILIQILAAFLMVESMEFKCFNKLYVNAFVVISLYSTILTVLLNLSKRALYSLPLLYYAGSKIASWRTFGYIYYVWDLYARHGMIRNSACFREPGVWGCFASIAIIMKISQIKKSEKRSKKDYAQFLILIVGVVCSLSTTAYICLFMSMIVSFLEGKHTKRQYATFGVIATVALLLVIYYRDIVFSKFSINNTEFVSLYERVQGVSSSINCWLKSPVFGVGYTKYFENVLEGVNSISFLYVMGEYGLVLLMLFVYMLGCWIKKMGLKQVSSVIVLGEILVMFNTQNLIFMPIVLSIMFYGIKNGSSWVMVDKNTANPSVFPD